MLKRLAIYCLVLLCLIASNAQNQSGDFEVDRKAFDKSYLKKLQKTIETQTLKNITSVIVLKQGKLIVEKYYNGTTPSTLHDTRSLTKSFTSTLLGMAIEDGHIQSLDQQLGEFYDLKQFENYSKEKAQVTLRSLLTMSSGFDGFDFDPSSPGNEEYMYPTRDWVGFALNLQMKKFDPDELRWQYFTAGVVILGDILDKQVPGGLEVYAKSRLFDPLKISTIQWQYTPSGVVNTAGSCQLTSLDLAKYGQLYLNKGEFGGQQVLSSSWVDESFQKYYELPDGLAYGYLFWNKCHEYAGTSYETFAASGNGGNKVFVYPESELVIVITSTAYNQSYMHRQADQIVQEYLLPGLF